VEADWQVMRQTDAGDRPGFKMRRLEQREESPLGRAIEALYDQPTVVVAPPGRAANTGSPVVTSGPKSKVCAAPLR
jgi:hypothetical protein